MGKKESARSSAKASGKVPEGILYPYETPGVLRVAEPAVAYEIGPLHVPLEETLGLLSPFEQAEVLEISTKTLTRWRQKGEALTPQQTDRVAVLESIFKLGEQVVGRESLPTWLHTRIFSLDMQRPIDLLKTETGRRRVEGVLHRIAWGMAA